jgi:hypothetical protein
MPCGNQPPRATEDNGAGSRSDRAGAPASLPGSNRAALRGVSGRRAAESHGGGRIEAGRMPGDCWLRLHAHTEPVVSEQGHQRSDLAGSLQGTVAPGPALQPQLRPQQSWPQLRPPGLGCIPSARPHIADRHRQLRLVVGTQTPAPLAAAAAVAAVLEAADGRRSAGRWRWSQQQLQTACAHPAARRCSRPHCCRGAAGVVTGLTRRARAYLRPGTLDGGDGGGTQEQQPPHHAPPHTRYLISRINT